MAESERPVPSICPHLGFEGDQGTRFTYPAEENFCHRVRPAQGVALEYQNRVCLTELRYQGCPIYAKGWQGKLPEAVRLKRERKLTGFFLWFWPFVAVIATFSAICCERAVLSRYYNHADGHLYP